MAAKEIRFSEDARARILRGVNTLANAVKTRLDGYSGDMGSGSNLVKVQGVFLLDEREMYDDQVQMFGVMRDFAIHHAEL